MKQQQSSIIDSFHIVLQLWTGIECFCFALNADCDKLHTWHACFNRWVSYVRGVKDEVLSRKRQGTLLASDLFNHISLQNPTWAPWFGGGRLAGIVRTGQFMIQSTWMQNCTWSFYNTVMKSRKKDIFTYWYLVCLAFSVLHGSLEIKCY